MKGFVIYEGPSVLDGAPVVGIVTMATRNAKTGDMAQLWILRADVEPHHAVKSGEDASICGACPHRHHTGGACYVLPFQGPLSVYRAWKRGTYSEDREAARAALTGRKLRLGAYGDPAALPFDVVEPYTQVASGRTGYTHQLNHPNFDRRWVALVMLSVDSEADAVAATADGMRYFRVATSAETLTREVVCLAESRGMSCADCLLCDGGTKGKSVVIPVHGQRAARFSDVIAVG